MPSISRLAVFLAVFFPAVAQGQYVGVSAFAALSPHYPCEALLAATDFSARPAIAVLPGTFGDDWTCVARFIERNSWRPHAIEVHLSNETCRRNGTCADGELFPQFNQFQWSAVLAARNPHAYQAIADRLSNLQAVIDSIRAPSSTFLLSTGLEDNYTPAAFAELYPFVVSHWQRGPVVRSGHGTPGVLREAHSSAAKCGGNTVVANEDGAVQSYSASDRFLRRNKGCLVSLVWRPDHQGRTVRRGKVQSSRIPPKLRPLTFTATDVTRLGGLLFKHTH